MRLFHPCQYIPPTPNTVDAMDEPSIPGMWTSITAHQKNEKVDLFLLPALRLQKQHFLFHYRVVFQHAEGSAGTRSDKGFVVARHRHADEPDGDGARLGYSTEISILSFVHLDVSKSVGLN